MLLALLSSRPSLLKLWPLVLLSVLILSSASAFAKPLSIAEVAVSRMNVPWWHARFIAKQVELARLHPQLLWIGDSITQNWERRGPPDWQDFQPVWRRFYGDRHAVNLGFRGDSTCHVLWRLQHGELADIHPQVVVLLVGANNFGLVHTNAEQTKRGIDEILRLLRQRLPDTQVLVIGVLPSIRSTWVSQNTDLLDEQLRRLPAVDGPWLHYVDLRSLFIRRGRIDPTLYLDPRLTPPQPALHPTAQTQALLAQAVEPTIRLMLHDRRHD